MSRFSQFCLCLVVFCAGLGNAQELPRGFNQYKRVHQRALKKIVDGESQAAIEDLLGVVKLVPDDAESHYMLAVAYATMGEAASAVTAVQRGLELGLHADRFVAGSKLGLERIRSSNQMKALRAGLRGRPVHGPMLGCISGSRVRVWVRTAEPTPVSVIAWRPGEPAQTIESQQRTTSADGDFTAVLELTGLRPNTEYAYAVKLRGVAYREAPYRFRTLAEEGTPVKFRIAFGGGAGFVPEHEYVWDTIRTQRPDVLMLLGDNVYSDDPETPQMQHYCYYRRQSRPEFRRLVASTPVFSIWDDHDFGTNDCSGGPAIDQPAWKLPVYRVFRNNWVNPYYGGGEAQPGCYYDFYLGDVHFVMLDGRYYRNLKPEDNGRPTMLGPAQRGWLLETIEKSHGRLLVLCSPVPWVFGAKGDSRDTWNGFQQERKEIFDFLTEHQVEGVLLMSADRHRSDLWKIDRSDDYALYEFNSSRLTNQHVHKTMDEAIFSYNAKQSFGTVDIDTTQDDPTITYRVVSIDGEEIHRFELKRSQLQ